MFAYIHLIWKCCFNRIHTTQKLRSILDPKPSEFPHDSIDGPAKSISVTPPKSKKPGKPLEPRKKTPSYCPYSWVVIIIPYIPSRTRVFFICSIRKPTWEGLLFASQNSFHPSMRVIPESRLIRSLLLHCFNNSLPFELTVSLWLKKYVSNGWGCTAKTTGSMSSWWLLMVFGVPNCTSQGGIT